MELCIIGGAGRTGRHLLDAATDLGDSVTAVVRDRSRIRRSDVRVVEGDARDPEVLARAIGERVAVISAVAAADRRPTTVVQDIASALVQTLETRERPGRLVVTSSRNLVATRPQPFVGITRRVFRNVYADLEQAEAVVAASPLDWTIARATRLVDAPTRGGVWMDTEADADGGDWVLPRIDFAAALLDLAADPARSRQIVGINGRKR